MKLVLKSTAIVLVVIGLGIQAYIFLVLLFELILLGHTGVASAFGYGASLVFSVPAYCAAMMLIYGARIKLPMKWIHACYFGSHGMILTCMFTLPGNFA